MATSAVDAGTVGNVVGSQGFAQFQSLLYFWRCFDGYFCS
nr:MAG TPA: hypothetical protein [Microviridae sp.]